MATLIRLILLAVGIQLCSANANEPSNISQKEKEETILILSQILENNYIHQERIDKIYSDIVSRQKAGTYDQIRLSTEFADALTRDLINASDDYHFAVVFDPEWIARSEPDVDGETTLQEDAINRLESTNFGFRKLELLDGNVGYIRFDYFPNPEHSFHAGARAMQFVEHANALIFDMRYNRGGHNEFAQYIMSFLFDGSTPQVLHEYAYVEDGELVSGEHWTLPALPSKRMPDVPVFVLTSTTTFSAGEWFAYELKKLDRASIIGQTTTGASHAVNRVPINSRFLLQVPVGIGRDPVDKSDFEGIGVQPDVETTSFLAKHKAHLLALRAIGERDPGLLDQVEWLTPVLNAKLNPLRLSKDEMLRFVGKFEGREIRVTDGRLTYHWRGRFNLTLIPIEPNVFGVDGGHDFRFRFVEEEGIVVQLERIDRDGKVTTYERL